MAKGTLKKLGVIHIIWGEQWAKTDKQKKRYEKYQGDEMHFFWGRIKTLLTPGGDHDNSHDDDVWKGAKLMPLTRAIALLEKNKPFPPDTEQYYAAQLQFLKEIRQASAQ